MPSEPKPIRIFRRDQMLDFEKHLTAGRKIKWQGATGEIHSAKVVKSGGGDVFITSSDGINMMIYLERVTCVYTPDGLYILRPLKAERGC
jgi:hypothetical protein